MIILVIIFIYYITMIKRLCNMCFPIQRNIEDPYNENENENENRFVSPEQPTAPCVLSHKHTFFDIQQFSSVKVTYNCDCSICLEDFTEEDIVITMTCKHTFHESCLTDWFIKRGSNKIECPVCNKLHK